MEEGSLLEDDETDDQDNNWQDPLSREFARAKDGVTLRCRGSSFGTTANAYRTFLDEFLPKLGDRDDLALEFRRRIVEDILVLAYEEHEPFERCDNLWNELTRLGFSTIETQCMMSHFFVKCCNRYGHTERALALLDPLIVELERLRAEPTVTTQATKYYDHEIESLRKLRARLQSEES